MRGTNSIRIGALAVILGLWAPFVWGSDLRVQQSTLYPYQPTIEIQDDFLTGGTGSSSIGSIGWTATGTISNIGAAANRFGVVRIDTTAVSGTVARLSGPVSTMFLPANPHALVWIAQLNTNDANTTVRYGAQNLTSVSPPDHGIFFEKLDADTNWFCVTRAATVQTRTDSGVAVNTSYNTFTYTRNSAGVSFVINNATVCTHTANIPTTAITPTVFLINSAAAAKTIDTDYFQMKIFGLIR